MRESQRGINRESEEESKRAKSHKTSRAGRLLRTGAALIGAFGAEQAISSSASAQEHASQEKTEKSRQPERADEATLNKWLANLNISGLEVKRPKEPKWKSIGDQVELYLNGKKIATLLAIGHVILEDVQGPAINMEEKGPFEFTPQLLEDYVRFAVRSSKEGLHEFRLTLDVASDAEKVMKKTGVEILGNDIFFNKSQKEKKGLTTLNLFRRGREVKAVIRKINETDLSLTLQVEDQSKFETFVIKNGILIK